MVLWRFLPLGEDRDSGLKDPGAAQGEESPTSGVARFGNKNTGHPGELEFQINTKSFSVCLWAAVHQRQAGPQETILAFVGFSLRGSGSVEGNRAAGLSFSALRVFQPEHACCTLRL